MAYWDLEIKVVVTNKWRALSSITDVSNNDILDIPNWVNVYLVQRIEDIAQRIAGDIMKQQREKKTNSWIIIL